MTRWNAALFNWIYHFSHQSPLLDAMAVFLASYLPYLMVAVALFLVFGRRGNRRRLAFLFEACLALILSRGLITEFFHAVYHHPRPFDLYGFVPLVPEAGNSFPSGHATFLFALSYTIFTRSRKWGIVFFIASTAVVIARVYAGVHWPADIVGGAVIGIISGWLIHRLVKPYLEQLSAPAGGAMPVPESNRS